MFNFRSIVFALFALVSLLSFSVAQAITTYQGPSGPAFGYDAACNLRQISVFGTGQAPTPTIVTRSSTFQLATHDYGTSIVFAVEGLSSTAVSLNYGMYSLVGTAIQTVPMTWNSGGQYWEWNVTFGNDPGLVGIHLYFQCAHLFTSNTCNDYVVTDGVTFTIQ